MSTHDPTPRPPDHRPEPDTWFLRIDDRQLRGPIPLAMLREWAESGALASHEAISRDGHHWQSAASLPELEMDWIADIGGETPYGPFNILAARHLTERGILKPDSVLRRVNAPPAPSDASFTIPAAAESQRVAQLEHELHALRRDLAAMRQEHRPSPTATRQRTIEARIERHETLLAALQGPPAAVAHCDHAHPVPAPARPAPALPATSLSSLHEDGYVIWSPEDVREMARLRRFRASTLRWNVINSSLVTGIGVTVGALGSILETDPVLYTGLVLAVLGIVYFLIVMVMLLLRKAMNWSTLTLAHPSAEPPTDTHPVRGVLNITFYWFNRAFRPRNPD